jgi:hypothetical protein
MDFGGTIMYKYKMLGTHKSIVLEKDNTILFIPENELLPQYQDYLKWVAEGNVAEEWNPNGN